MTLKADIESLTNRDMCDAVAKKYRSLGAPTLHRAAPELLATALAEADHATRLKIAAALERSVVSERMAEFSPFTEKRNNLGG